ncbi:MAG: cytochrome b/b6 domain-containing protein [Methanosarcinales archaeon]|nr:cytochrome b/b6 domain-containing protein [Methanosarcinales archaeon]
MTLGLAKWNYILKKGVIHMQGNPNAENDIVGKRYTMRDRIAHQTHMITCVLLIITGLYIALQFNICTLEAWALMSYQSLRLVHVVAGILFLLVNWTLIPFNLVTSGHMLQYIFGPKDAVMLKQAIVSILKKEEYPKYTIFNKTTGHYENKLHPAYKLMVIFEGIAIVFIGLSGIIMIDLKFGFVDYDIAVWNNFMAWFVEDITGTFSVLIGMTGIEFIRTIHLWATYWFVLELIIHIGFLGVDPRMSKYLKALFITGNETMDEYTKIIEGAHDEHEKKPLLVFK